MPETISEKNFPKYPVYIISKGRWESRLTAKALEEDSVKYKIVVEPQEFEQYSKVIDKNKILILPFSNLGLGGIPARNWVYDHAVQSGAKKHWIIDDNIDGWGRLNKNLKIRCHAGTALRIIEDFSDRYENIAMAGPEYDYFLPRKTKCPPYRLNTRIYSCILLRNNLSHRWRGRYNEDTDLSLRHLKDGLCTILMHSFYSYKTPTLEMGGGNTDAIYNTGDKRKQFAESLRQQHPDIVKVVWRYNRWHHEVNYNGFKKNKLQKISDIELKNIVDEYGLILKQIEDEDFTGENF
jgi:hypothetical protein